MTTELVKFDEVIQQSGLAIQDGEEIKQSYLPFAVQLAEVQEQAGKINFENPTGLDETIARELRLRTVKIRTGASDLKDSRKKIHLLKGNLEQAAYNLIAASCKLSEETFTTVEKAREIAEAKRRAELKSIRDHEVLPLADFIPYGLDLGKFSEEDYQKLIKGARLQQQARIEFERKAEAARLLAEKKAKSAPDKQKLSALSSAISGIVFPEMATIEGMAIADSVKELLKKTVEFITKKAGEL